MSKDPVLYLHHILDCTTKILQYTQGFTEEDFLANAIVQDATLRNFEIMGEATKQLPTSLREKYPQIPWKSIAGMRDKLIHDYIGVDLWAVWAVITDVLPDFKTSLEKIIAQEESGHS